MVNLQVQGSFIGTSRHICFAVKRADNPSTRHQTQTLDNIHKHMVRKIKEREERGLQASLKPQLQTFRLINTIKKGQEPKNNIIIKHKLKMNGTDITYSDKE